MTATIRDQVLEAICEVYAISAEDFTDQTAFSDLGDSLDRIELTFCVEDTLDIVIPEEQDQGLRTVGEFVTFCASKQT